MTTYTNDAATLALFTNLLNFPDTTVSEIRHSSNDREITLVVKSPRKNLPCRICGHPTQGHSVGRLLRLRHLPLSYYRT